MKDRRGVAVVLVLIVILGGGALAHGALLAARGELLAARARAERLERQGLERAALDRAVGFEPGPGVRGLPTWGAWRLPDLPLGPEIDVVVRRVGSESWWASIPGRWTGGREAGSPGLLLWWMDPAARVAAIDGVVTVGPTAPVEVWGVVDRYAWGAAQPPLTEAVCEAALGTAPIEPMPNLLALLDSASTRPALGLLPFDTLLARTPVRMEGAVTPAPAEAASQCVFEDAGNWGDPERPSRPCGGHFAVRGADASLRVVGGVGQGAWVVDGDMTLEGGARLHGFIITSGALVLEEGAELHGAAVAAGGVRVGAGTLVRGSACWTARALHAAAAFWSPGLEPVPGVGRITP
jgi:hypothetical protein